MNKLGKLRIGLSLILALQLALTPAVLAQDLIIPGLYSTTVSSLPTVAATQTPVTLNGQLQFDGATVNPAVNGNMVIDQTESRAILDWESFNIGQAAWVHFNQQGNTDWAALNRIYDANPSQIYGRLTAGGEVFLINQNGILFGPDSQIDVHSLTASSLFILEDDFLNSTLTFTGGDDCGAVSNHGTIQAGTGGTVYLVAPEVENHGTIDAPGGQVALVAGTDVDFELREAEDRVFPYVYVNDTGEKGTAVNGESGSISADTGIAGLYGREAYQNGYIRSITAITNNGRIELHASQKVVTGENSVTETPVSDDDEEVHASFELDGGEIHVGGLDERYTDTDGDRWNATTATGRVEHYGEMTANSGTIAMEAEARIYLGSDSTLDVSGLWVAQGGAETVEATLNSVEMKNEYTLKDGILVGETVEVVAEEGSSIGDVSSYLAGEYQTAQEMATAGGDIMLTVSDGDIIQQDGATIDISGGGLVVGEGYNNVTVLLSGTTFYSISDAPTTVTYDAIATYNEKSYDNYGIVDTYEGLYLGGANPLLDYTAGYIQGDDAGTLTLIASAIVLEGILDASVVAGRYQTDLTIPEIYYGNFAVQTATGTKAPRGGELIIGDSAGGSSNISDFIVEEVVITGSTASLPEDFDADDNLGDVARYVSDWSDADGYLSRTVISAETLNDAGLSDVAIYSNTSVTIAEDAAIALASGGAAIGGWQHRGVGRTHGIYRRLRLESVHHGPGHHLRGLG